MLLGQKLKPLLDPLLQRREPLYLRSGDLSSRATLPSSAAFARLHRLSSLRSFPRRGSRRFPATRAPMPNNTARGSMLSIAVRTERPANEANGATRRIARRNLPCLLVDTLAYTSRARPRRVAPRAFGLYTPLPRMPKVAAFKCALNQLHPPRRHPVHIRDFRGLFLRSADTSLDETRGRSDSRGVIRVPGKPVDDQNVEHDDYNRQHRRQRDVEEPPDYPQGGEGVPHNPSERPAPENAAPPIQRDKADDQVDDAPENEGLDNRYGNEAAWNPGDAGNLRHRKQDVKAAYDEHHDRSERNQAGPPRCLSLERRVAPSVVPH